MAHSPDFMSPDDAVRSGAARGGAARGASESGDARFGSSEGRRHRHRSRGTVRVRVRRRRSRSPLAKGLRRLGRHVGRPLLEILISLASLPALLLRSPLLLLGLAGSGLWLAWPFLAPGLLPRFNTSASASRPAVEVISVLVEDPQRTLMGLALWRKTPGSLLVLQGRPSSQRDNLNYLRHQGKWPRDERRILRLEPGCDTVGQIDALSRLLGEMRRSGHLTMVTSPAHLPRTLAITRILVGPLGWTVSGQAAVTGDNRPEGPWRTWRDQIRAQILRITGLTGSRLDSTCR